jgi:anti-sigma regulatory factor (Ser/Thr protein kinase)
MSARVHTRISLPAQADQLRLVRATVRSLAMLAGADSDRVDDISLAVGEACANVVAHAYGDDGGELQLLIDRRDEGLVFVVSDSGRPIIERPTKKGAGLGLALIRELSDSVTVEGPGNAGTVVVMTFALPA